MSDAYSALKFLHHPSQVEDLRTGRQPIPVQVQLVISDLCNENCSFCSYRADGYTSNQLFAIVENGERNSNPNRMILYDKVCEILDDCKKMGVKAIQITGGGEPTVHPDHARIFQDVLSCGMDLALVTNGVILKPEAVDVLTAAKWVRISIDAAYQHTYSSMREVSGETFERVWRNVEILVDAKRKARSDVVIGLGFVVTRENYSQIQPFVLRAKNSGVDNVRISAVFQSDDERYFDSFYASALDYCRFAREAQTDSFTVYDNFGERLEDLKQHNPDYSFCGYQHFNTYIGADLNVYRCCVYAYNDRGILGSIKDQRFRELWESQGKRDRMENFDARGCERCQFNAKNRAINYAIQIKPEHVNFV